MRHLTSWWSGVGLLFFGKEVFCKPKRRDYISGALYANLSFETDFNLHTKMT